MAAVLNMEHSAAYHGPKIFQILFNNYVDPAKNVALAYEGLQLTK